MFLSGMTTRPQQPELFVPRRQGELNQVPQSVQTCIVRVTAEGLLTYSYSVELLLKIALCFTRFEAISPVIPCMVLASRDNASSSDSSVITNAVSVFPIPGNNPSQWSHQYMQGTVHPLQHSWSSLAFGWMAHPLMSIICLLTPSCSEYWYVGYMAASIHWSMVL